MMSSLTAITFVFLAVAPYGSDPLYVEKQIEGATLKITVRQPISEQKAAQIVKWLEDTAGNINLVYGRFPNPTTYIIVIPDKRDVWRRPPREQVSPGQDSDLDENEDEEKAVRFGRVTRSNGATVELFVNAELPIDMFYTDWTATHEFSHLMLPLLKRQHRWISEGFATYYQNILMSRAGHYTPEYAWTKLTAGFERGRQSAPGVSPNAAAANRSRDATMKIYWSGAALALLADVELRQRSDGTESLDRVLGQLQDCCLPANRQWSGPELLARLDSFVEEPVFMPLYRRIAEAETFPDLAQSLTDLGVIEDGETVSLSADAAHADIRESLSAHAR